MNLVAIIVLSGTDHNTSRLMLCGHCVLQSLCFTRDAPWTPLWVFVFKKMPFYFGHDGWNRVTKGRRFSCVLVLYFRALFFTFFIFNFSEGLFYHLLRAVSQHKACVEIFSILFDVNYTSYTIIVTQVMEFIGRFYHLFHGCSNKTYICHVLPKSICDN